jgi:heme A synthase
MNTVDRHLESGGRNGASSGAARNNPWMVRYTMVLAVCVLVAIVLGASVTSEIHPIPGSSVPHVSLSAGEETSLEQTHALVAIAASILILGLAVWIQLAEKRAWLRGLGWAAAAVVVVSCLLGMSSVLQSIPHAAGFFHALLAHILLSLVVAMAVGLSRRPERHQILEDSGKPSLRSLAAVVPSLAFLQVLLGAAYRHEVMA